MLTIHLQKSFFSKSFLIADENILITKRTADVQNWLTGQHVKPGETCMGVEA